MTAVGLGQHGSPAEGPGPSLCRGKYFHDLTGICQKFHSNGSHRTVGRTTGFWTGRSGFDSLSRQISLWFHWHLSEVPMVPMALWVGQHWFEAVDTGSNPSLHLHFKLLRRKILILPPSSPPLLSLNFFAPGNLLKHSTQGFPYEIFRYCETKQVWRKIVIPAASLIPNIFRYQNFSETEKGSSSKCFDTVRQNNFDGKSWYPPPLLSPTFFDTRNFLKHRRVPLRSFSALWDKNFPTENRDTV